MQQATPHIDYKSLYEQSQIEIAFLKQELAQLKKIIFGSGQERFLAAEVVNPQQLSLNIQAETVAAVKITDAKKIEYTRVSTEVTPARLHPGRHPLPAHLERREQIIEPAAVDITSLKKIGEEVTEELEYEPGKLFVNKIIRPKYARLNGSSGHAFSGGEEVIIAPMPDRPLPKAIAGPGLLAQVVIDKYIDHLPLHRQMERFKREGVSIAYSTLADMVSGTCSLILPVYEALKKQVLACSYLHADETPIKVLDKDKKGQTHRGFFWVYHSSIEKLVLFDYQFGRGREGPKQMLEDFKGFLQTDGYSVYDFFKEKEEITVLHCMAHARRMFYEAQANDADRSAYALEQFAKLYAIERTIKEQQLQHPQVLELRQQKAVPVLQSFGRWMKEQYIQVLPKSAIGKALGYSIERWDELNIYATNGQLNIDNNPVENSIRPVAIGRKNYLFAGSHEAAQRSAMLYSLLGTCKLYGINPFIWLREMLRRIATHPISKIDELLPQNFSFK